MQPLAVKPHEVITSQQSLQSIQTLLRAGLGCITYLRNLLPADNFSESYLTSSGPDELSSQPSDSSSVSSGGRRNVSGFKIMTVTRGFTEEADKLLDYLENGIFDALQKHYLRKLVFAVYLDDQDPNNIIEAYTFNFSYCEVPGTKEAVPVMTLGEEMDKLSLSGSGRGKDPVSEATRKGKVPTLGEVKRSLKTLIKNLIQATTQMDALPKRRFATFKLFYYDSAPDDYEPPHFRAGDANRDKWFMTTHHKGEVPERCSVGFIHTGYHGVDMRVTSVSAYLPSGENNNAPFLGTTDRNLFSAPSLTPVEEAAMRAQQIEVQRLDADQRRVVWDGDDSMEHGADCHVIEDGNAPGQVACVGIRKEDGSIVPFSLNELHDVNVREAQFAGRSESIPMCIAQLAMAKPQRAVSPTQLIDTSQVGQTPPPPAETADISGPPTQARNASGPHGCDTPSSLPPSDLLPSISSSTREPETIDTQYLKDVLAGISAPEEDSVMLDMETQQVPDRVGVVEPFIDGRDEFTDTRMDDTTPDCECGVQLSDCDLCCCDGGCERWFHLWCMGYHSDQDHRIPEKFICFDCRVRADRNWDLIVVHDLYPQMIARFKDLAIQRRGIKIFETQAPDGLSAFTKMIGCDSTVAGQVFKRLEAEGFIAQETREVDESGLMEVVTVTSKRRGRGGKANPPRRTGPRRKNLKKPVYVFVQGIKNEDAYKDYFDPDPDVEKRLLGLSDLKPERKNRRKRRDASDHAIEADDASAVPQEDARQDGLDPDQALGHIRVLPAAFESQTQEETQILVPEAGHGELKRKTNETREDQAKKIKISLVPPVDLGD